MSGQGNHFNRLPEDVIIFIFDKVADAKSLCISTLISKKIGSLVLQTKIVSVQVPSYLTVCSCHPCPTTINPPPQLFRTLLHFLGKPVTSLWSLLKQPFITNNDSTMIPKFVPIIFFLLKFPYIESLTLIMGFSKQTSGFEPLVKWKDDKFGFTLICAKGVCLNSSEALSITSSPTPNAFQLMRSIAYHVLDAIMRASLLQPILSSNFPKLKNILVLDSLNQGRVFLSEDDIAFLRNLEEPLMDAVDLDDVEFYVKLWHENVVDLPLSGSLLMKEVTVFMFKHLDDVTNQEEGDDCLAMSENVFEVKEYCEVGMVMVKKQPIFEGVVTLAQIL